MVVVDGHGAYVPLYRVDRASVADQHGGRASGESAVPARDENHVTMACEAAGTALDRSSVDAADLGAVLAASVTDPFAEHGVAAQAAYRLGATGDVRTGDFRSTRRAVTDAVGAAVAFAEAGETVLVVASDVLPADPDDDGTAEAGAGAAAFVVRSAAPDPVARLVGRGRETTGFVESHREHGAVAETGDARFERRHGVTPAVESALGRALDDGTGERAVPDRAVAGAPDGRMASTALDAVEAEHVTVRDDVGDAGTAGVALDLVSAFETSEAGSSVLAVNYGSGGADALLFETDEGVERTDGLTVADLLDAKEYVSYARHLEYREPVDYKGVGG
jgi:3-hydroxy-3-methylglutaryl CoA synthase